MANIITPVGSGFDSGMDIVELAQQQDRERNGINRTEDDFLVPIGGTQQDIAREELVTGGMSSTSDPLVNQLSSLFTGSNTENTWGQDTRIINGDNYDRRREVIQAQRQSQQQTRQQIIAQQTLSKEKKAKENKLKEDIKKSEENFKDPISSLDL